MSGYTDPPPGLGTTAAEAEDALRAERSMTARDGGPMSGLQEALAKALHESFRLCIHADDDYKACEERAAFYLADVGVRAALDTERAEAWNAGVSAATAVLTYTPDVPQPGLRPRLDNPYRAAAAAGSEPPPEPAPGLKVSANGSPEMLGDAAPDLTSEPAPDVWSGDVPPGGFVCGECGTPTESEPCAEHQQDGTPKCLCGRSDAEHRDERGERIICRRWSLQDRALTAEATLRDLRGKVTALAAEYDETREWCESRPSHPNAVAAAWSRMIAADLRALLSKEWVGQSSPEPAPTCDCGWGGVHDPDNPRCARNQARGEQP